MKLVRLITFALLTIPVIAHTGPPTRKGSHGISTWSFPVNNSTRVWTINTVNDSGLANWVLKIDYKGVITLNPALNQIEQVREVIRLANRYGRQCQPATP